MNDTVKVQPTPGEWRFNPKYKSSALVEILNDEMEAVDACIECHSSEGGRAEDEANARLCSAAKELLFACKFFISTLESGQLVRNFSNDSSSDWARQMMEFVQGMANAQGAILKAEGR